MAIDFEELNGSGKVTWAGGTATATRIFNVVWDDAFDFVDEVLGGYGIGGAYNGPGQYPYLPYLWATEADMEGFGVPDEGLRALGRVIKYTHAKITIKYEPQLFQDDDDPQTVEEESLTISTEMMTLPSGSYEYTGDGVVVADSAMPGMLMTTMQYNVSRTHVSSLEAAVISGLIGRVNDNTWRGWAAGLVLFPGVSANRKTTTDGREEWNIDYSFLIRTTDWNHIYRPTAAGGDRTTKFQAIRTVTGHHPVYDPGDFTNLIPA